MDIRGKFRTFAPSWDRHDTIFAGILAGIVAVAFATFVDKVSVGGLANAALAFMGPSGLIAIFTAGTAMLAFYRHRHNPNRTRPTVREDFDNLDATGCTDFGLRNFGPGPALYVQAVITVEYPNEEIVEDDITRHQVHDTPIHLREGEFVSLLPDSEGDWLRKAKEKYEIGQATDASDSSDDETLYINLYFTYLSQSGVRTPPNQRPDREDDDILDELKNPESDARRIELYRVVDMCRTES